MIFEDFKITAQTYARHGLFVDSEVSNIQISGLNITGITAHGSDWSDPQGYAVTIEGTTVTLSDFIAQNSDHGFVTNSSADNVTLTNLQARDNGHFLYGGGHGYDGYFKGSSITVDGFTSESDYEDGSGYSIAVGGENNKNNTIRNLTSLGDCWAGIYVAGATNLTIEDSLIKNKRDSGEDGFGDGGHGIILTASYSTSNTTDRVTITNVTAEDNNNSITLGSEAIDKAWDKLTSDVDVPYDKAHNVTITNCDIENNGIGIWMANGTGNEAHYNNIVGNTEYGALNDATANLLNATNNWWGDVSGPSGFGEGTGDKVSANVTYRPWSHWKGQSEAETAIGTVSDVSASFDAIAKADTEVKLSELGTGASGSITVVKYPATPSTATTLAHDTGKTALKYVDVQVGNLTQGNALIKVHYTDTGGLKESSLRLYYWDGSNWMESQSSSVDTTNNYVQGTIPVNKLTGTSVAAGGSPQPAPTQVPEFSPIGLFAFISILSVVLAVATLRKRE